MRTHHVLGASASGPQRGRARRGARHGGWRVLRARPVVGIDCALPLVGRSPRRRVERRPVAFRPPRARLTLLSGTRRHVPPPAGEAPARPAGRTAPAATARAARARAKARGALGTRDRCKARQRSSRRRPPRSRPSQSRRSRVMFVTVALAPVTVRTGWKCTLGAATVMSPRFTWMVGGLKTPVRPTMAHSLPRAPAACRRTGAARWAAWPRPPLPSPHLPHASERGRARGARSTVSSRRGGTWLRSMPCARRRRARALSRRLAVCARGKHAARR